MLAGKFDLHVLYVLPSVFSVYLFKNKKSIQYVQVIIFMAIAFMGFKYIGEAALIEQIVNRAITILLCCFSSFMALNHILALNEEQNIEKLFRETLDDAPYGILTINGQGEITFANKQLENIFGHTADELKTMTVEELTLPTIREKHILERNQFFKHPTKRIMGEGRNLKE